MNIADFRYHVNAIRDSIYEKDVNEPVKVAHENLKKMKKLLNNKKPVQIDDIGDFEENLAYVVGNLEILSEIDAEKYTTPMSEWNEIFESMQQKLNDCANDIKGTSEQFDRARIAEANQLLSTAKTDLKNYSTQSK